MTFYSTFSFERETSSTYSQPQTIEFPNIAWRYSSCGAYSSSFHDNFTKPTKQN